MVSWMVMLKFAVFLLCGFCLTFFVPDTVVAGGLVPCGGIGQTACQSCDVVKLTNNVVEWLIIVLGTLAALIIMYAGIQLVTAGGNQSAMEAAKSKITNVIIGYVIILAAWLVVDYGLKVLLITDGTKSFGVWNDVECTVQDTPTKKRKTTLEYTEELQSGVNGGTNGVGGVGNIGGTKPPDLSGSGACSYSLVSRYFPGELTGAAQCIIRNESACGARSISRTDVMYNDGRRAFSFGPMQINLTVHTLNGCAGYPAVLNCKSAFSGRNYTAVVINEALYQQCARAAQNFDCNIKNGRRIYAEAGNRWSPWSTARACGLN